MILLTNCLVKVMLTYELSGNSNELLDCTKYREFLHQLSNISFFRMTASWSKIISPLSGKILIRFYMEMYMCAELLHTCKEEGRKGQSVYLIGLLVASE